MKSSGIETKKTIDIFSYFTFACFMCTFKEIADGLENICCKKNGGYRHEVRPFAFDLYEDQPLSDGTHLKQSYFFKSNEDTDICVMFSNCSDGWFTLVNVLSKAIQCEACLFSITSSDVLYGALNGFHYINNGKSIRTVYAMQDPHWVFYEDGKQLWFEDGKHYKQHTIKKRMNKEILVSYCTRLGFDIYSPQFCQSKQSVLLAELPRNRKSKTYKRNKSKKMKLTDKRFGIFEFMMLLCGILTTCIEALNYGISLFDLMGHLLVFPLCFCMGGIATWKIIKRSRVWLLSGFSLLFSFIAYNLFHLILYPIYGVSFASVVFWEAAFYFILFSIIPVIICSLAYKWIEKHYIR